MTGVVSQLVAGGSGNTLLVTANDVTRVVVGSGSSRIVASVQLPNTSVTGGVAPYAHLWEYVSGSTDPLVSDETAANPTWTALVPADESRIAVWRLTVTDSATNTDTVDITVNLSFFNS